MSAAASLSHATAFSLPRLVRRVTPLHIIIAAVTLAAAVRMIGINHRVMWLDEAYSAWFSTRSWHELWTIVPTYEPHPPFYYSLLKIWRSIFGGGAVALRGLSVLASVLTVPVIIAAAYEQEEQEPSDRPHLRAVIAALLAACSPMLIMLDQEARPYPLLILAYAVAILGLLRLRRELATGPGGWTSWALLAVGAEAALWAHGLGAVYALCLAAALAPSWLKAPPTRACLVRGLGTALAIMGLYLPCLMMMASRAGDWGTGWLVWKPVMLFQLISLYSVPYETLTVASAVAALVMWLLFKRAIQAAIEACDWNSERALLLLWAGPPLLAVLISVLAVPVFLPRTLAATLVPAYLAIAGAVARTKLPHERFGLAAALIIILPVSAIQTALRPAVEQWDRAAAYLNNRVGPNAQVWLYPNDSALPLREAGAAFHARGIPGDYPAITFKGPIRAGSPAVVSLTSERAERIARDPKIRSIPIIWLVTRQSGLFDPHGDLPNALSQSRRAGPAQSWGYITIQPYFAR